MSMNNIKTHRNKPAFVLLAWLPASLIIACALAFVSSCSQADRESQMPARSVTPADTPRTEEPIVALVGRSVGGEPIPYFVLYGDGFVIFGHPGTNAPQYASATLTPDQVREIYSSAAARTPAALNGRTFTPAPTFLASYFLLIREANGNYLRTAAYSLPPYDKWPAELRPPDGVVRTLDSLAHYSVEKAAGWTPREIEVEFQPAVPSPDDKSWWPKSWPQPKMDRGGKSGVTVLRVDGSHAEDLGEYLRRYPLVSLPGGTYDVWARYPFPHEGRVKAAMEIFSMPR